MSRATVVILAASLLIPAAVLAQDQKTAQVKRGEYLVTTEPLSRLPHALGERPGRPGAGHEAGAVRPPAGHRDPAAGELQEPWVGAMTSTLTAWSGPWGVSFSANLTPDPETGVLRDFTEEQFVQTLRTGRHQGQGRQILPPMPWPLIGQMTDDDLKAIYAYLKQIPPVRNKVPDPIPAGMK